MVHQHEEEWLEGVLGNGDAAVLPTDASRGSAFDGVTWAFRKLTSAVRKTPGLPGKALHLVSGLGKSGKIYRLEVRIERYEKRLRRLFYEIGKEGLAYSGEGNVLETEAVESLMGRVQETELKIERVKQRIEEIREEKEKKSGGRKKRKDRKNYPALEAIEEDRQEALEGRNFDSLETAIDTAIHFGEFKTSSERDIFQKIATDLLDNDIQVRILAATELGKIGKEAAIPILLEAARSHNGDLVSEIINSLISLGDKRAVSLFREKAYDPGYRIRIACLRGLYKLADQEEDIPVLREALRDAHPEVRRTAATFLGWKDRGDAVPALVQCLRDEDRKVRKAAVSALAHLKDQSSVLPLTRVLADNDLEIRQKALQGIKMISGNEGLRFDVYADGSELETAIEGVRNWWERERLERVYKNGTGMESLESEGTETEATAMDISIPMKEAETFSVVEMPVAEEFPAKEEDLSIQADPSEELLSEDQSGEISEAVEETAAPNGEAMIEETAVPNDIESETVGEKEFPEKPILTEDELKKMLKADLLSICTDLGIEADESLRKSDLIDLVLKEKE